MSHQLRRLNHFEQKNMKCGKCTIESSELLNSENRAALGLLISGCFFNVQSVKIFTLAKRLRAQKQAGGPAFPVACFLRQGTL